ncbi:group II truncated hemoglobin [soil metagenome]
MIEDAVVAESAFALVGGAPAVRRLVDTFYALVEHDLAYAELRAMHADDLGEVRASLAGFLAAWLGGPRDWFVEHPGVCMMSRHRAMPITEATARQWTGAMEQALRLADIEPRIAEPMLHRFLAMADAMSRR